MKVQFSNASLAINKNTKTENKPANSVKTNHLNGLTDSTNNNQISFSGLKWKLPKIRNLFKKTYTQEEIKTLEEQSKEAFTAWQNNCHSNSLYEAYSRLANQLDEARKSIK